MQLTDGTRLTFRWPRGDLTYGTWNEFITVNRDDVKTIEAVRADLEAGRAAFIGGGATMRVEIGVRN